MFYIYLIINKTNRKMYVGKTGRPENRFQEHIKIAEGGKGKYPKIYQVIHAAISKYGSDNFIFNLIDWDPDEQYCLTVLEPFWIKNLKANNCILYNMTDGGEGASGFRWTLESKLKLSKTNTGKIISEDTKTKMSEAKQGKYDGDKNPFYGKTHSKAVVQNIILRNKNRIISEDTREKLSKLFSGENNPFYGKQHTEESRKQMSDSKIGQNTGENNYFFGKHFIGETHPRASITEKEALQIITLLKDNFKIKEIMKQLNIGRHVIDNIKRNKTWKHLPR